MTVTHSHYSSGLTRWASPHETIFIIIINWSVQINVWHTENCILRIEVRIVELRRPVVDLWGPVTWRQSGYTALAKVWCVMMMWQLGYLCVHINGLYFLQISCLWLHRNGRKYCTFNVLTRKRRIPTPFPSNTEAAQCLGGNTLYVQVHVGPLWININWQLSHLQRHGIRGKSISKLIFIFSPLDIST